jgi:hypothetical protein
MNATKQEGRTMAAYSSEELQDEFLKVIRTSQETVVDALKTWVDTVKTVTPKVPSSPVPLPRPADIVSTVFDFADRLLSSQRQFAEELVKVTASLMPGSDTQPGQGTAGE